jgi:mono/diheme cytochrome c family protein
MRYVYYVFLFVCVLTVSIFGFRGSRSEKPPLEVFPDMDRQPKYKPQGSSTFFADGRSDRPLPPGVVARGDLRADVELYSGKNNGGQWLNVFPAAVSVDAKLMERGRHSYTIYCAPCHGATGDGNGITKQYGMGATPSYHDERLRKLSHGEIYNVIANGKGTMLPYADKIAVEDRWAVVAYVRALQRAAQGTANDVPPAFKNQLGLK